MGSAPSIADTDVFLELFLSTNPNLQESLISKGMRGGNVWFRIQARISAVTHIA